MSVGTAAPYLEARTPVRSGRSGFTLVETMIAVVCIGIVVAFAIPRIDMDAYRVNAAVRGMNSALMYAERQAISLQHDVRVSFDTTNARLRIHEDANNDGIIQNGERVTYANIENGIHFNRVGATPLGFGGAPINLTKTQLGLPMIIFRRDGTGSENGGFYIAPIKSITSGTAKNVRAGEVVRSSGRILWYTYSNGTWVRGN